MYIYYIAIIADRLYTHSPEGANPFVSRPGGLVKL